MLPNHVHFDLPEIWQHLDFLTLVRLFSSSQRLYQLSQKSQTWIFLLNRDFNINWKDNDYSPKDYYEINYIFCLPVARIQKICEIYWLKLINSAQPDSKLFLVNQPSNSVLIHSKNKYDQVYKYIKHYQIEIYEMLLEHLPYDLICFAKMNADLNRLVQIPLITTPRLADTLRKIQIYIEQVETTLSKFKYQQSSKSAKSYRHYPILNTQLEQYYLQLRSFNENLTLLVKIIIKRQTGFAPHIVTDIIGTQKMLEREILSICKEIEKIKEYPCYRKKISNLLGKLVELTPLLSNNALFHNPVVKSISDLLDRIVNKYVESNIFTRLDHLPTL